jgi:hypothetical protein
MTGDTSDSQTKPFESILNGGDALDGFRRVEDQGEIGAIATLDRSGGSGAAGLFVDDRLEEEIALETDAKVPQHLHHAKDRGDTALGIDLPS